MTSKWFLSAVLFLSAHPVLASAPGHAQLEGLYCEALQPNRSFFVSVRSRAEERMLTLTEVFESTRLGKSFYYDVFGIPMKDVSFKKESGTWKLQYLSSSSQSLLKGFRILINGEVPIGARKWVPAKLSIVDSGHEESMQCRSSIRLRPGADE